MGKSYLISLVLGDISNCGHRKSKEMRFRSNYPPGMIMKAYTKSCNKTGIQFHKVNDCIDWLDSLEDWRTVFTDRQRPYMDKRAADVLSEHGIDMDGHDRDLLFSPEAATDIIMKFIGLSMPKDWELQPEEECVCINHCMPCAMGYGLFDAPYS